MHSAVVASPIAPLAVPVLSPEAHTGILDFLKVYDAYYDYILRSLTQTSRVAPAPVAERLSLNRELLQRALGGDDWPPYLTWLWAEGARLAETGQSLPEAIKHVGAARAEALPYVWELFEHDLRRQASAVRGLAALNELEVSLVAQGHVEAVRRMAAGRAAAGQAATEQQFMSDKYAGLLETAPDAMVIVDAAGRIVVANSQTETVFGYARQDLVGQPIDMLVPERFRDRHPGHRTHYFVEPRVRRMGAGLELYGLRQDGSEFPVEISLSPLLTEDGLMVTAAIRDATERRRFEQALREKNVELEAAIQAKDRFLASMSHELRTPLNAILGFTGTLLMKLPGPLTLDQEKQLRTVQTSARHLLSLINDLLDLVKIESGKVELNPEPVVCQSVLAEVLAALAPLAAAKRLRLEAPEPQPDLLIHTDRRALAQILLNLTNNAIKFTDAGEVRLALSQRRGPEGTVTEITVADTGIGIRPGDQARLFQAFEQVAGAEMRRREGTGLGLHLSQKLAGLLGGQIAFESTYGRGSTFRLVLVEA